MEERCGLVELVAVCAALEVDAHVQGELARALPPREQLGERLLLGVVAERVDLVRGRVSVRVRVRVRVGANPNPNPDPNSNPNPNPNPN